MSIDCAAGTFNRTGPDARSPRACGQVLVETALVLPIFVLLLMGLFDLGRVVYAQHTITQDSREATRTGQVTPAYSAAQYMLIRSAALAMSPGVALANANITGLSGTNCATLSPGNPDPVSPSSCFYPDGIHIGNRVVVSISVNVPLLTPVISQLVGGSITVTTLSIAYVQ